ncbi:uncharacterized protein K452DRAFT_282730 [Aplosporella prunicola CBS 121167]|uniref:Uncharacterized protein n=1 Tax=Aplosporella prunicola CBS 121167 TaxID=1176127 RepID=A0A6A6BTG2_9PEZI|nr:uncharacterized protein K452DRAFT_282730 [Aplosporella prunicola CBS 121167]KAF2146555.1 hypothetical protein K452DRAFT_282730 [Aplosporella prunicola CBS 121167]
MELFPKNKETAAGTVTDKDTRVNERANTKERGLSSSISTARIERLILAVTQSAGSGRQASALLTASHAGS